MFYIHIYFKSFIDYNVCVRNIATCLALTIITKQKETIIKSFIKEHTMATTYIT